MQSICHVGQGHRLTYSPSCRLPARDVRSRWDTFRGRRPSCHEWCDTSSSLSVLLVAGQTPRDPQSRQASRPTQLHRRHHRSRPDDTETHTHWVTHAIHTLSLSHNHWQLTVIRATLDRWLQYMTWMLTVEIRTDKRQWTYKQQDKCTAEVSQSSD